MRLLIILFRNLTPPYIMLSYYPPPPRPPPSAFGFCKGKRKEALRRDSLSPSPIPLLPLVFAPRRGRQKKGRLGRSRWRSLSPSPPFLDFPWLFPPGPLTAPSLGTIRLEPKTRAKDLVKEAYRPHIWVIRGEESLPSPSPLCEAFLGSKKSFAVTSEVS